MDLQTLFRDLRDPDAKVREKAVRGIGELGLGPRAVRPLLDALNDPVGDVRAVAASALGRMGVDAKEAVPALVRLLRDPEERARGSAAGALAEIGVVTPRAVPALVDLFGDEVAWVRRFSGLCLESVRPGRHGGPSVAD